MVTEIVRLDIELGLAPIQPINGYFRMVIVKVAGRQVGIVVEDVVRKDEIVIKSLGEFLRNVKLFPGATIAPDGSLILLIDVNRLVAGEAIEQRPLMLPSGSGTHFRSRRAAVAHGAIPAEAIDFVPEENGGAGGRLHQRAQVRGPHAGKGRLPREARRGRTGGPGNRFRSRGCDLVMTDLEMPRTNGYELMSHLRQDPANTKHSGHGGHVARGRETSRPRYERRRNGIPDQAGAGRPVYCGGRKVDWITSEHANGAQRGSRTVESFTSFKKPRSRPRAERPDAGAEKKNEFLKAL